MLRYFNTYYIHRRRGTWATSWSTPTATRVLWWWRDECLQKGVALNDGTCDGTCT